MKYLLDTNVVSEAGKTVPHQNVDKWFDTVDDSELAISAITVRELRRGEECLRQNKPDVAAAIALRNTTIIDAFDSRVLPVDRAVAERWAAMLGTSMKHVDDAGIAATAAAYKLTLVTRNVGHMSGRGIAILDPFKSPAKLLPAGPR